MALSFPLRAASPQPVRCAAAYFDSHLEAEKAGRVKRCAEAFRGELLRLHLLFLAFIMVPMNKFNALFQVCTLLRILLI